MPEIIRVGGGEERSPEVHAFEQKAGTEEDVRFVNALGFESIRSALALWTAGATYGDIAVQMRWKSPRIAQIAVERALSDMVDDSSDRPKLRRRMSLTLDRFLKAITPKAIDPNHPEQMAAIRAGIGIVDRFAKLHGLDEAVKVDIHMPGQAEFQQFIEAAALGLGMEMPVEADIFSDEFIEDAEVVDDAEGRGSDGEDREGSGGEPSGN